MFEAMKHQKKDPQCYRIDMMEEVVQEVTASETPSPLIDHVIINSIEQVEEEVDLKIGKCLL